MTEISDFFKDPIFQTYKLGILPEFTEITPYAKNFLRTNIADCLEMVLDFLSVDSEQNKDKFYALANLYLLNDDEFKLKMVLDKAKLSPDQLSNFLSMTGSSEIIKLLLSKGAIPTKKAVFCAFFDKKTDLLKMYADLGVPDSCEKHFF